MAFFRSSASASAISGLQTDPALTLWELGSLLPEQPTRAAYQQTMERASKHLVASYQSRNDVLTLKQKECPDSKTEGKSVKDKLSIINAFRFEYLENLRAFLSTTQELDNITR